MICSSVNRFFTSNLLSMGLDSKLRRYSIPGGRRAYQSDKNLVHIQNAKAKIEQSVMPNLWALGPALQNEASGQLVDIVKQSTMVAREAVKQLTTQRDALRASQSELKQKVQESHARLESLAETVAKQKAEAASVVALVQQMYAEKEAERIASFSTMLQELRSDFAMLQADSKRIQSEQLESLNKSQKEAARIVQVVGNTGLTGNYQKIAEAEGKQADLWRWITIGFFAVGIVIAVVTFVKFLYEPLSPETALSILIRLVFAVAIATPAWYLAKESARHRTNADRARQTELELASLGPFIELMPEEKKNEIREELTRRYFGNQAQEHTAEPPINIQKLADIATKLMKAAKREP